MERERHLQLLPRCDNVRKPKVDEFQSLVFLANQNVFRLQVAMYDLSHERKWKQEMRREKKKLKVRRRDVVGVAESHSSAELEEEESGQVVVHSAWRYTVQQVSTLHMLHADVQSVLFPIRSLQVDDVPMPQLPHDFDLSHEIGLHRIGGDSHIVE